MTKNGVGDRVLKIVSNLIFSRWWDSHHIPASVGFLQRKNEKNIYTAYDQKGKKKKRLYSELTECSITKERQKELIIQKSHKNSW